MNTGDTDPLDIEYVIAQHALAFLNRIAPPPNGRRKGQEYQLINPIREDRNLGSFSVNMATGAWADFATEDRGRGFVDLVAYMYEVDNSTALAWCLGLFDVGPVQDDTPSPMAQPFTEDEIERSAEFSAPSA